MKLKKSIFSYIVWAALVPLCCLSVVFTLERAGIGEMLGIPLIGIVCGACVYLLLTAAVFLALRTICAEIGRHIPDTQKAEAVLSVIMPVTVLVGVVVYLVLYLIYHTPLTLEEDRFYSQALVSDGKGVPFAVHGASWLYTCLLRVMMLVFGNTPFAGVVLQIVLFFICLLLLYVGMQAFTGTIPAAFSMALFGFLPTSFQHVFSLTPELFYLAFYLLGFSLTGALYKKYGQRETSSQMPSPERRAEQGGSLQSVLSVVSVFLLGIYIGFLVYLDIYGISLYLFLAVLFSAGKGRIKQAAVSYFTAVFGGICGFLLPVMAVCQVEKTTAAVYLRELYSLYVSGMRFEAELSRFFSFLPDVSTGGSILLISLAFCMIPAFFLWKKSQGSAFIVNLFLVCGLSGFSVFLLDGQMITAFAWIMLAGLGVYGVVRAGDEPDEESAAERAEDTRDAEDSEHAEDAGNSRKRAGKKKDNESRKKKTGSKPEREEKAMPENTDAEGKAVSERAKAEEKAVSERAKDKVQIKENKGTGTTTAAKTVKETGTEKKEQEKPAPGEPLHNPLPVPKKKSRLQADFGYQVAEDKMKFDLDVSDEDDFDW